MRLSNVAGMGTQAIGPRAEFEMFIVEWRELMGKTQEWLAAEIGVDKSTISRYETGTRIPKPTELFKIAKALEIKIIDLFRHPDVPSIDGAIGRLPETDRQRVLAFIEALLKTSQD